MGAGLSTAAAASGACRGEFAGGEQGPPGSWSLAWQKSRETAIALQVTMIGGLAGQALGPGAIDRVLHAISGEPEVQRPSGAQYVQGFNGTISRARAPDGSPSDVHRLLMATRGFGLPLQFRASPLGCQCTL